MSLLERLRRTNPAWKISAVPLTAAVILAAVNDYNTVNARNQPATTISGVPTTAGVNYSAGPSLSTGLLSAVIEVDGKQIKLYANTQNRDTLFGAYDFLNREITDEDLDSVAFRGRFTGRSNFEIESFNQGQYRFDTKQ